jgi:hypothetical protein
MPVKYFKIALLVKGRDALYCRNWSVYKTLYKILMCRLYPREILWFLLESARWEGAEEFGCGKIYLTVHL